MSKVEEITTRANPNKNNKLEESSSMTFELEMPTDTNEAVSMYGEKVAFSKIHSQVVIDFQGFVRRHLENSKTEAQIKSRIANVNADNPDAPIKPWAPGVSAVKKSKVEKLVDQTADMSDVEFKEFLENLQRGRSQKAPTTGEFKSKK